MKVIRFRLIIFVALLFVFMIPQSASAEINITPVAYDQHGQARAWYYTEAVEYSTAYMPDQTVKSQIYLSSPVNIIDINGNYYIASGYLDLVSTVYDFPNKGWKTGNYKGTIGCYIY